MRRLFAGCCGGLLLICFGFFCVSGVVLAASQSTGGSTVAAVPAAERAAQRQDTGPTAAARFDDKLNEFASAITRVPAGGPPAKLTLAGNEVTAKVKQQLLSSSDIPPEIQNNLFFDFQSDRVLITIIPSATSSAGQNNVEVRVRAKLVPNGKKVKVEVERIDLANVFPFVINITPFVAPYLNSSSQPLEFDLPFLVQSISMQGGNMTIEGLPAK